MGAGEVLKSQFTGPSSRHQTIDTTTLAGQQQAVEILQKISGDSGFHFGDTGGSHEAQWEKAKNLFTLALSPQFVASNLFHEGFHKVYDQHLNIDQRGILTRALDSLFVKKQLKDLLEKHPEAWKDALADPREMAAYAFQFWHSGDLQVGPQTNTIFQKLVAWWGKINDWLRNQPDAQKLMEQIRDGQFADGPADPATKALATAPAVLRRVRIATAATFKMIDKIYDAALYPFDTRVRDMGNPFATQLAKQLYNQVGEEGARGLANARPAFTKKFMNQLDNIAKAHSNFGDTLKDMVLKGDAGATDQIAAKKVRAWLNQLHQYQADAGIPIKKLAEYMPLSWDGEKIRGSKSAFTALFRSHQADLDKLNAELLAKTKDNPDFKPMTPESIWNAMQKRGTATDEFVGGAFDENGAPRNDHALDRVFSFLTNAERAPFVKDDLHSGLMRYAKNAVNSSEWSRRFGHDSSLWNEKMAQAKEYGMTKDQEKLMKDYKDAIFGARLHDMNPTMRSALAGLTVYQNYRVLGLSLLSNIIDPFGVAVRSGEWGEAWNAYKMAMSRLTKKGRLNTQQLQGLAETIGALERAGVADSVHEMYGGVSIEGKLRTANDALFNYNGMNGLTRSVRLAALAAGTRYLVRHASQEGNERHLAELNLDKSDVKTMADGQLAILPADFESIGYNTDQATKASERVQTALNRFVDESSITPNAGERTAWGAIPELAPLYHLKQYVFSFNKVMNKKMEHELLEHDNKTPYAMAAAYIPIMAATGMMRDMIYNAGSLPPQNGFLHYMGTGFMRSGLAGPSDIAELGVGGAATGNMNDIRQLLGPTADQVFDIFASIANPHNTALMQQTMAESLPGGALFQHYAK